MNRLAFLLFLLGDFPIADTKEFPKKQQQAALMATVRITNVSERSSGSGVIVGSKGPFVYILTAHHLVKNAKRLEIATFSADSYPKPKIVYRNAQVLAREDGVRDLALVRVTTGDDPPATVRICPPGSIPKTKRLAAMSVGCNGKKAPTCLPDLVAERKRVRRGSDKEGAIFWELNSSPTTGRSGGPLLDKTGLLIGVCSGVNAGKGYYCHIDEIHWFLRRNGFKWLYSEEKE